MNILLIEDDDYKANQIKKFVEELDNFVELKKSFKSGMESITKSIWDFILLDMSIPSFEISNKNPLSRNRKFGGRDILNEMHRKNIVCPTVVITQYSVFGEETSLKELDEELSIKYSDSYKGIVFYNASVLDWQLALLKYLQ